LEKLKEEGAFVKQLELLKSLGYDNELQNLKLLQRFEGNMEKVLERLVSKNEKYQNNKRFFDKKESNETSKDHSKIKKERFSEEERKEIDDLKEKISKLKQSFKVSKNDSNKKEIKSLRERINQIRKSKCVNVKEVVNVDEIVKVDEEIKIDVEKVAKLLEEVKIVEIKEQEKKNEFQNQLNDLKLMGFEDEQLNLKLLKKFNSLEKVVTKLLKKNKK